MVNVPGARLPSLLGQLAKAPVLNRAAVTKALDAALEDGVLTKAERAALHKALLRGDRFDSAQTKAALTALLTATSNDVVALAHKLTRKDGVLDLRDARQLTALVDAPDSKKVASLNALMVGTRLSAGAQAHLTAQVGGTTARQQRLDKQPLRTMDLTGDAGAVLVSRSGLRALTPPTLGPLKDVQAKALEKALAVAVKDRGALLKSGGMPATSRVVPEDGSLKVRAFHMAAIGSDHTGLRFPIQMAQVGKLEGFSVVLRVPLEQVDGYRKEFKKESITNIHLVGVTGEGDFWSEDQGELDVDGNVRVPAPGPPFEELQAVGFKERVKRLHPRTGDALKDEPWATLGARISKEFKDAAYAQVGAVAERKSHEVMAGVALAKGTNIRASLTHLEGGNVLVGTRPDGEGYALVGRDSLAQSRYILAKDRGKVVSDADLMAAVAHDLGIKPQHVVAVEQPGDFHLDMHMMPVAPGEVMVNDPVAAQKLSEQWERADHLKKMPATPRAGASAATVENYKSDLAFWKELGQDAERNFKEAAARAQKQATAEERSIRDLEKAGIKVHRVPAVFGPRHAPQANFINAEQGTNPKGERFYIALGGDPRAERVFVDALAAIKPGIARIHFLDRDITMSTLVAGGGISCRTKAEGIL